MESQYESNECNISWEEKEKIRHEINTCYSVYRNIQTIMHYSVGLDNRYYIYYVRNIGYDDYEFLAKVPNLD